MKAELLPSLQQDRNQDVRKRLMWLGGMLWLTALGPVLLGAALYLYASPAPVNQAQCVGATGTSLGDAAIVGSDTAICPGNLTSDVDIIAAGVSHEASRLLSNKLGDSADYTLFKLHSPIDSVSVYPSVAEVGSRLKAGNGSQTWEGNVVKIDSDAIVVEPEMSLPDGTPTYLANDGSALVGISAHNEGKAIIVPISRLVNPPSNGQPK